MKVHALLALSVAVCVCDALYLPFDSAVKHDTDYWNTRNYYRDPLSQGPSGIPRDLEAYGEYLTRHSNPDLRASPWDDNQNRETSPFDDPAMRRAGKMASRIFGRFAPAVRLLLSPSPAY
ncbi:uncharacterized protein LOC142587556 [Dermacentor variabilis]|uniref:uncharacterized protein LOC142587556 n=1 Tax=Dermacentor variabilis TaxID=34621 RepID=UPI003F5CA15B